MTIDTSVEKLIKRLSHTLFRWKWFILITFLATTFAMLFVTFLVTPSYRAANRVLVSHNYKQQVGLFRDLATPGQLNTRVNFNSNFLNILKSEIIAGQIVSEFGLAERLQERKESPEAFRDVVKMGIVDVLRWPIDVAIEKGWLGSKAKDWHAKAVEEFLKETLDAKIVEDTEIIEIGVYESSPALANAIADRLTELLTQKLLELNRSEVVLAYEYALEKSKEAKKEYVQSRDALERLKRELRVASFEDEKRLLVEHKESLEQQHAAMGVLRAGLLGELEESENQLRDDRLLPTKRNEIISRMSNLRVELAGIKQRISAISSEIEEAVAKIDGVILKENTYTALKSEVELAERMYFQLRERVDELSLQKETNTGEFGIRIVDRQRVSPNARPDSPGLVIFFPLIIVFSLGASLGLPILIEFFRDYPLDEEEVAEITNAHFVGSISKDRRLRRLRAAKS